MGAHSTINITQKTARRVILEKIMNATDVELEEWMDDILYDRLYNCNIVSDDYEDNQDYLV